MLSVNFVWVALVITVWGNLFYIRDTLKGETQPNRVTFFLWGAAPLVAYFSQRTEGAGAQIFFTLTIGLLPLVIFAASFVDKKAYWKITKFDIVCGALSAVALIFLLITGNGVVALALSLVADFFASLPTLIKSYKYPESETPVAYAIEMIAALIVLLTVQTWTFINYVFPLYIFLMCVMFTLLLMIPRKKTLRKTAY